MKADNYSPTYKHHKAQIGRQVVRKIIGKKRRLRQVNEYFSRLFYAQDAPNMGFSSKRNEEL